MKYKVLPAMLGWALLFPTLQLSAQNNTTTNEGIAGYYRIQNAYGLNNDNSYVQVTGRVHAEPDQAAADVPTQPGSVIYVSATPATKFGKDVLKVTSLRSQGIEVIGDEHWNIDDFIKYIDTDNSGSKMLESEREMYMQKGYVATIRAMIEYMFVKMAGQMKNSGGVNGQAIYDMTAAFNKTVSENIDIDMYMVPSSLTQTGKTDLTGYRLFETITDMSEVEKFYKDETKYTYGNTQMTNREAFKEAFKWIYNNAYSYYDSQISDNNLKSYARYVFGMIRKSDIEILEKFARAGILDNYKKANIADDDYTSLPIYLGDNGYDIGLKYTDANGQEQADPVFYAFDFDTIFSDPELLYNWLKLRAYNILNKDNVFYSFVNDYVGGDKVKNFVESLSNSGYGSTFLSYFPRIHSGQSYFLIRGEVHNSEGTVGYPDAANYSDQAKFGFVSEDPASETVAAGLSVAEKAGDADKWVLKPLDTDENYFSVVPSSKMQGLDGHYYTTLCVDFPITGVAEGMHLYKMSEGVNTKEVSGTTYNYVTLEEISSAEAGLPLIVETTSLEAASNKVIIGTDKPTRYDDSNTMLKGSFLGYDISDKWYLTEHGYTWNTGDNIYTLNKNKKDTHNPMGFYKYTGTTLGANKAFIIYGSTSTTAEAPAKLVIGEPSGDLSSINGVETTASQQKDEFYDLSGRRVANPQHGIYVINGKKVLVK